MRHRLALLLGVISTTAAAQVKPVEFKTAKAMPDLEKCISTELLDLGDATFMRSPGDTILMIREGQGQPLIVEIAPPKISITTRASADVVRRVQRCT